MLSFKIWDSLSLAQKVFKQNKQHIVYDTVIVFFQRNYGKGYHLIN